MSARTFNQIRIYNAALPEEEIGLRASEVIRLLALGLIRTIAEEKDGSSGGDADTRTREVEERPNE